MTTLARRLRKSGWVPFIRLNGVMVWVGPSGELATPTDALALIMQQEILGVIREVQLRNRRAILASSHALKRLTQRKSA